MTFIKLQAVYLLLMGLWPLLHLRSFEAATGPKIDKWLVKSIAWLFIVIGLQLWFAADARDVMVISLGSAVVVAGADIYYSLVRKRISRAYLLDVPQQLFFY